MMIHIYVSEGDTRESKENGQIVNDQLLS